MLRKTHNKSTATQQEDSMIKQGSIVAWGTLEKEVHATVISEFTASERGVIISDGWQVAETVNTGTMFYVRLTGQESTRWGYSRSVELRWMDTIVSYEVHDGPGGRCWGTMGAEVQRKNFRNAAVHVDNAEDSK
jgi:hypothetical protein